MLKLVELDQYALTDVETVRDALGLDTAASDDVIRRAINKATDTLEAATRRNLVARSYVWLLNGYQVIRRGVIQVDGLIVYAGGTVMLPEWPVVTLASVESRAAYVDWNPADTTGWSEIAGLLTLPQAFLPQGTRDIRVTATAGYDATIHATERRKLADLCIEIARVHFQAERNQLGQTESVSIGNKGTVNINGSAIPERIAQDVRYLRRVQ